MKLLSVIFALCSVTIKVQAQALTQDQYLHRRGPDRIYFTNIDGQIEGLESVNTQKTEDTQKQSQNDHYTQNVQRNDYAVPSGNQQQLYSQHQLSVLPKEQNYFGNPYDHNVTVLIPKQSQNDNVQPQRPPQRQQTQAHFQPARSEVEHVNRPPSPQSSPVQGPVQNGNISVQGSPGNFPVSRAIASFGLNLLKLVNPPMKNVVMSPFSISTVLSLLQQGARGQTQQQISAAIQMTPEYSAGVYKTLHDDLKKRDSHNILKLANNVFVADAFEINKNFKSVAINNFGSEVTPMKFYRADAADRINNWVASKTNNKIERLLTSDAVDENTQAVLVNAIYFKGIWAVKFRPESTQPRDFQASDGSTRTVPFMHLRKVFRTGYDSDAGAQVLILPFEKEQYSLMLILPSTLISVDTLLSSLTDEKLIKYNTFSAKDVSIHIPKFTARSDIDLNTVFQKLGVTNVFGYQADLSGLGLYHTNSLHVSKAVHSAMLSIDEEGGTAAAATAISAVALSYDYDSTIEFNANRPFLAVLWDNEALLPLFMARIENPSTSG